MAEVSEPLNVNIRLSATCLSDTHTEAAVAGHTLVTDEPEIRGGTNLAASPVQMFFASLLGCVNVFAHKCARNSGVEIFSLDLELDADVDRRGMMFLETIAVPFPSVSIRAKVKTNATDAQWRYIVDCLHTSCPIVVAVKAGGTTIHQDWKLIRERD